MSTKLKENNSDNTVTELQNMMFQQMKRLSDPECDLDKEIKRGMALSSAGGVIINAAKVKIDAARLVKQSQNNGNLNPKKLGNG